MIWSGEARSGIECEARCKVPRRHALRRVAGRRFSVLEPRGFYSTSGACSVSAFTTHFVGERRTRGMHTAASEPWDRRSRSATCPWCWPRCGRQDESRNAGQNRGVRDYRRQYRRQHRRLDFLGDAANSRDPARRPAIQSPAAELLVGFQAAIVRVLLQCFCDLRRLGRVKIHVLSISYANPPRPPHPRTRSVFSLCRCWGRGLTAAMSFPYTRGIGNSG
jgi:hypothetical protein